MAKTYSFILFAQFKWVWKEEEKENDVEFMGKSWKFVGIMERNREFNPAYSIMADKELQWKKQYRINNLYEFKIWIQMGWGDKKRTG